MQNTQQTLKADDEEELEQGLSGPEAVVAVLLHTNCTILSNRVDTAEARKQYISPSLPTF